MRPVVRKTRLGSSPIARSRRFEALHHDPAVALALNPSRAPDGQHRNAGRAGGLDGIGLHLHGEGMGCVDDEIETLLGKNARKAASAAEAAGAQPPGSVAGSVVLPASDRVTS